MAENINSFSENVNSITKSCSDIIEIAEGMNEAIYGNDTEVVVSENITLPSFSNVVKRLERAEKTMSKFTSGEGVVETTDGTFRKVKAVPVFTPPQRITEIEDVSTFDIDSNWFFEELQYPKCIVEIDLTDKIDESSDRVYVNRVIIDANGTYGDGQFNVIDYYNDSIKDAHPYYTTLISMLETNKIEYREDKEEIQLPLSYEKFHGEFRVIGVNLLKGTDKISRPWYTFETITYDKVDFNGIVKERGFVLKTGDMLRFNGALYKIAEINTNTYAVRLESLVGYSAISTGDIVELYTDPFTEKKIRVGVGINEINIVYVRSVDENYNMMSREWSEPISFITNELSFSNDPNETFLSYYIKNVSDFGKTWISQAKERMISAFDGKQPLAPSLNQDELRVVQINRQLDSKFDKERYNNLVSQITSLKSSIESARSSISSNKDMLVKTNGTSDRDEIEKAIESDTASLANMVREYTSAVNEMSTMLNDAGVINYTPKYRIRGFFKIPESRYADEDRKIGEEKIIAFETMYRYLHRDDSGVTLETYGYSNGDNVVETGVFTDWNIVKSETLSKEYDIDGGTYRWVSGNTADGSEININQIDIPIRKGEKVEIKVRSISEAGYPYNPLKSAWSNSVIISFPDNLTTGDPIGTVVDSVKNDMTTLKIQQTMSAAGVYSHMSDTNSSFKHSASGISYLKVNTDDNTETEIPLQNKVDDLDSVISNINDEYNSLLSTYTQITEKLSSHDSSISILSAIPNDIIDINGNITTLMERDQNEVAYVQNLHTRCSTFDASKYYGSDASKHEATINALNQLRDYILSACISIINARSFKSQNE